MKRIILIILALSLNGYPCWAASRAQEEVKKGNFLYEKGKFTEALKSYEQALADTPESDVVNFNLGAALYKAGSYEQAIEHFEKSLVSEDKSLEQNSSYNIGNAKYKYGMRWEDADLAKAIGLLEQSLRHYLRAIELDPEDEDARYNYEFVKKELERLKNKQQKQKQQQSQGQPQQQPQQGQQQKQQPPKQDQQQPPQSDEPPEGQNQGQGQQSNKPDKPPDKQDGGAQGKGQGEGDGRPDGPEQDQGRGEGDGRPDGPEQDQGRGEGDGRPPGAQAPPPGMSEQEAEMLLDNYGDEEEPKGLYKGKLPARGSLEDFKDW